MRLLKDHVGHRVRKPEWPNGIFFEIEHLGNFIVIAKNEQGKQVQFNRNEFDKDWLDLGNYNQEGHHVRQT